MKFQEKEFLPVFLGANLNSYSLAREFHQAYKVKSVVLGKYVVTQIIDSKILDFIETNMDDENMLLVIINNLAKENFTKKIILLGCSDTLLKFIMRNKDNFAENIIAPYVSLEQGESLMDRDSFYKLCDQHNIPYPQTFKYSKELKTDYLLPFDFPVVLKPDNQPLFFSNKFEGQKKVYIIKNKEELDIELNRIYSSGYDYTMTIQEFIPGSDSQMYVVNAYANKSNKVIFMSFANALLEEHTPSARGNYAFIVNSRNKEICDMLKTFLESINYTGFANFDLKLDPRTNTFKVFEINIRQGNSHYHVTAAGNNLPKIMTEDIIYNKPQAYRIAMGKKLFHIAPILVGLIYVKPFRKKLEIIKLTLTGQAVNPLFYWKDMSFKRFYYLTLNNFGHFIKFWKYYKDDNVK